MRVKSALFPGVLLGAVLLATPILTSCGGTTASPPPVVFVSISPSSVNMPAGGAQTFLATVTGSSNTAVTWTVQEGAAGGSITGAGFYTAPSAQGTYHITATSQADSTKSATATVTVAAPLVSVAITPAVVGIRPGGAQTFTATVTGSSNTAVIWAVQEGAAGGTITDAGVYTAPPSLGTYHVVATSVADANKSATAAVSVQTSGFFTTGSMSTRREFHTATLLPDATVLIAGGDDSGDPDNMHALASAELYNPATGSFSPAASMATARFGQTATSLPDGKVLVTGGFDSSFIGTAMSGSELYDPTAGVFMPAGAMTFARGAHTATLLADGRVLVAGGSTAWSFGFAGILTGEVYNPATNSFTPTGAMATARYAPAATLLPNGKVLVSGGLDTFAAAALSTAELYDPATGTFTPTGSMGTARGGHTATLLPNGQVLVAGGFNSRHFQHYSVTPTAELYDPATNAFTAMGNNMTAARAEHTATLLPDGKVLITGGALATAEFYDPATGSFTATDSMTSQRSRHTATLLRDGTVLIVGGGLETAEIFKQLP